MSLDERERSDPFDDPVRPVPQNVGLCSVYGVSEMQRSKNWWMRITSMTRTLSGKPVEPENDENKENDDAWFDDFFAEKKEKREAHQKAQEQGKNAMQARLKARGRLEDFYASIRELGRVFFGGSGLAKAGPGIAFVHHCYRSASTIKCTVDVQHELFRRGLIGWL